MKLNLKGSLTSLKNLFSGRKSPASEAEKAFPLPGSLRDFGLRGLIAVLCALLLLVGYFIAGTGLSVLSSTSESAYYRGVVTDILGREENNYPISEDEVVTVATITFSVKIQTGDLAGQTLTIDQQSDPYSRSEMKEVRLGDTILVSAMEDNGETLYQYYSHYRMAPVIVLCICLLVLILLVGRFQGIRTVFLMAFTILTAYAVLVPALITGKSAFLWVLLTVLYLSFVYAFLGKSVRLTLFSAWVGSFFTALLGMAFTGFLLKVLNLTGIFDEQAYTLSTIMPGATVDLIALIFSFVVLVPVGSVCSLSEQITAGLERVREKNAKAAPSRLLLTGIAMGKELLPGAVSSLTTAVLGATLPMILLLIPSNLSLMALSNREIVLVIILELTAGPIGVLLTVPVSSFAFALFLYADRKRKALREEKAEETAEAASEPEEAPKHGNENPFRKAARILRASSDEAYEAAPGPDTVEEEPVGNRYLPQESDSVDQSLKDLIDEAEEGSRPTNLDNSMMGRFVRMYRELDEDFDEAEERSKKRRNKSSR